MFKLWPQESSCDGPHGPVVLCLLLVAGRQSPELLEPVYQTLDLVTGTVYGSIKATSTMLVLFAGDRDPDPPPTGVPSDLPAAVPFVANHSARSLLGSVAPHSLDGILLHQRLEDGGFVPLAWRQYEGHGLAVTFSPQVHLGGEASPAPT